MPVGGSHHYQLLSAGEAVERQRFVADCWVTSPAHLGLALALAADGASTTPSEKRYEASGCDARPNPLLVTLTPCS